MATVSGTFSADGASSELFVEPHIAATGVFVVINGTFGSGTAALQLLCADDTWRDIQTWTANAATRVTIPTNSYTRLNLTGSTTPNIFYQLSETGLGYKGTP